MAVFRAQLSNRHFVVGDTPVIVETSNPGFLSGQKAGCKMPTATKRPGNADFVRPSQTSIAKELISVFNRFQQESYPMAKSVSKLRSIYDGISGDKSEFFRIVTFLIQLPLSRGSIKERMAKNDEKILDTVCKFSVSFLEDKKAEEKENRDEEDEDEDGIEIPEFLRRLFDWLLDQHSVEASQARLRICLMVNRLLRLLGDDAEIDDDLYQKIFDNMLERMKDKVAEIRAQAVTALQRLQNPRDESCPIVRAFIFHLGCDPSAIVRRTIVKCIGAARLTLTHVVKRTLDIDEHVRRAAYKFIADKVRSAASLIAFLFPKLL